MAVEEIVPLWEHQKQALEKSRDKDNFAYLMDCGTGKTLTCITKLREVYTGYRRCLKTLILCPASVVHNWEEEINRFSKMGHHVKCLTGTKKKRIEALENSGANIFITNFEALDMVDLFFKEIGKDRKRKLIDRGFEVLVVDECFAAGTPVDTPDGSVPIESIRVGDRVYSAAGVDKVKSISSTIVTETVDVKFAGNKVTCSGSHPWLTLSGWVEARNLKIGDTLVSTEFAQEELRVVQKPVHVRSKSRRSKKTLLREILFSEMAYEPTGDKSEASHTRSIRESKQSVYFGSKRPGVIETYAREQPYDQSIYSEESTGYPQAHRSQALGTRRQRLWSDAFRSFVVRLFGSGRGIQHGYKLGWEKSRLPNLLQSRRSLPRCKAGYRSRWSITQRNSEKSTRHKKGTGLKGFRVDGITLQKCGDTGGDREGRFYDIGVERHPSYSVHGALVHNCHRLKNHKGKRAKVAFKIADQAAHKFILTGTPIVNSPEDIWAQFRILDGGDLFGQSFYHFRNHYFKDYNAGMSSQKYFPDWRIKPGADRAINKLMYHKAIRVMKHECLDLPDLLMQRHNVTMSPDQEKHYNEMRDDFITYLHSEACVATLAITKALRLQQIVSGFLRFEDGSIKSFKNTERLQALSDLLEDNATTSKVIVWAAFKDNYEAIAKVCDKLKLKYTYLTGAQSQQEKNDNVKSFCFGDDQVLIANPQAGGTGINLIQSSVSIWFSRTFRLEDRLQALARNHRGGSEIHDKITNIDLVCPGTIDEKVLEALDGKESIAESILNWREGL